MKRFTNLVLVIVAALALFLSCNKDNDLGKLRAIELEKLEEFIQANYPNVEPKPSGLYYIEEVAGQGDTIKAGDKVQIFYSTWTIDSVLIDETSGYSLGHRFEPYEFIVSAGDAISGLEEGANYMRPGTICNLVIPSELAYGQNGTTGVAGFTTLLMQVEVYKVYPIEVSE
jgi:FKBP-type peptidyl-prolyl cis-trans isomerase